MKVFIELVSISFLFCVLVFCPEALEGAVLTTGTPGKLHDCFVFGSVFHFFLSIKSLFIAAMLFCWLFSHLVLAGVSLPRSLLFWVWVISPCEASLDFPPTAQLESEGCYFCRCFCGRKTASITHRYRSPRTNRLRTG